MVKVVTMLSGGLGNQLFQYAAARGLAERHGAELVVDSWSGFVRDMEYRRIYELDRLPIDARLASPIERLPFWTRRLRAAFRKRLMPRSAAGAPSFKPGHRFRVEATDRAHDPGFLSQPLRGDVWVSGYWQSPLYFDHCADRLAAELTPPTPTRLPAIELGQRLAHNPGVAIGIRLYEEARHPGAHSSTGRLKAMDEINGAIETIHARAPDATYLIFCSHRAPELAQLKTPSAPVFVTGEEGFADALESLWLMTRCRHHVITNSSFYWWGAWLAEALSPAEDHVIAAAANFINADTVPTRWRRF
ncbi:MAG: alpha-1,2-fucosyltransferase [Pseudomonadota bacterium]